jgi:hypothetical protein
MKTQAESAPADFIAESVKHAPPLIEIATAMHERRETLKERTIAGMKAAKLRGKHVGRPSALNDKRLAEARRLIEDGKSQAEVARVLHVSPSTIARARLSRYSPRSKEAGPVIQGVATAQLAFEAKQERYKNDPVLRWLRGEPVEGFKSPMIARGSFSRSRFKPKPPPPQSEAHKSRQRHLLTLIAKEAGLKIDPWSDDTDRLLRAMHTLGYEVAPVDAPSELSVTDGVTGSSP